MIWKKFKFLVLFFLAVVLITSGFGCKGVSQEVQEAVKPTTIVYWRVWDSDDDFASIVSAYKAMHPYVNFEFRFFRYDEYEQALLDAFAEDRGPDIFSLPNTWIGKYQSKMEPLPAQIKIPYVYEKSVACGLKKEQAVELRNKSTLNASGLKSQFLSAVYDDVLRKDDDGKYKIYALPYSVDTMVLYFNRDILDNYGIPEPPYTWQQLQEQVKTITRLDKKGNIVQSAIGLGTANNVERNTDILSLLMMQNGAVMVKGNSIEFDKTPAELKGRSMSPGAEALTFYTDFASPVKEVYTWNDGMPNSLDTFIAGQTAFFLGYAYHLPTLKARAPKLNFEIVGAPQIEGNSPINMANYWVEGVSKKSQHIDEVWDFLLFATAADQAQKYLEATKKPTALRSLQAKQLEDEGLKVFASQLLTAKSWYNGKNPLAAEKAMQDMIGSVVKSEVSPEEAIRLGASKVQQTMY